MKWDIIFTKKAEKDLKKIKSSNLESKFWDIIDILKNDPFQNPPNFEKLDGDFSGAYSRRINIQHRIVYEVLDKDKTIKIIRAWSHYE